ncbi:MAG: hypothetical protein JSV19_12105 [Phycisphaerales bacterium]|nr:MAG: hypothetical protein JSV19_12105 [Phycisphaerales bacterium]
MPEALRREARELVDSPARLWREMFSLVRKHPPGWWWALDRPGDMRRCLRMLLVNMLIAGAIVLVSVGAADSLAVQTIERTYYFDSKDPQREPATAVVEQTWTWAMFGRSSGYESDPPNVFGAIDYDRVRRLHLQMASVRTRAIVFATDAWWIGTSAVIVGWMILLWLSVAGVGIWTQIRKGLPKFAKPPKTIIAASCVESCKLVYLGLVVALAAIVECATRLYLLNIRNDIYKCVVFVLIVSVILVGVLGWVGALRSDFTRQLIRSRVHLIRILLMYALAMPFALLMVGLLGVGLLLLS